MKITSAFLILWIIQSQLNGMIVSGWLRNKRKTLDLVPTEQEFTRTAYSDPSTRYPWKPISDLKSPSPEYDSVTFMPNRELIETIQKKDANKVDNEYSVTPQYEMLESEKVVVMEGPLEEKSQSNARFIGSDDKERSFQTIESDLSSSYPLHTTPGLGRDAPGLQNKELDLRDDTFATQKKADGSIGGQRESQDITTIREENADDRRSTPYIQGDSTAAEFGDLKMINHTRYPEVEVTKPTAGSNIVSNEIMTNKYGPRLTETVKRSKAFKSQTSYMMEMTEPSKSINASDSSGQLPSTSSPSRRSPPTTSPSSPTHKPQTESNKKVENSKIYVTFSTKYKTTNKKGSPPVTSLMASPYNRRSSDDTKCSTSSSSSSSRKPSTEYFKEVERSMIYLNFRTQFKPTNGGSFPSMMTSKYGYYTTEPKKRVQTFKPQTNYMIKTTEPSQYINVSYKVRTASPTASPPLSPSQLTTSLPSLSSEPPKTSSKSPLSTASLPSNPPPTLTPSSLSKPSKSSPPSPPSTYSQPSPLSPISTSSPPTSPPSPPSPSSPLSPSSSTSNPSKISPPTQPLPPLLRSPLSTSSLQSKPPTTSPTSSPFKPSKASPPSTRSPPSISSPPSSHLPPSQPSPPSASSPPSATASQEHNWSTESIKKIVISKTYSNLSSESAATKNESFPTLISVKISAHNNRPYENSKYSTNQPSKVANSSKIFHIFSTEYRMKRQESFRPLTLATKFTLENERFINKDGSTVQPSHKPIMIPSKTTGTSEMNLPLRTTKESFRSLTSKFTNSTLDGQFEGRFNHAKTNSFRSTRKTMVEATSSKDYLLSKRSTKVYYILKNPASSSSRSRNDDDKEIPLAMAHGTNNNNNFERKRSMGDKIFGNNLLDPPERYDSKKVTYVTKSSPTRPYSRSSQTSRGPRINRKTTEITWRNGDIRTTTLRPTTASKESPLFRSEVKWKRRDIYNIKDVFDQICSLDVDQGGGSEAFSSWYYNVRSRTCEWFSYQGKRGNGNRFTYRANCENVCVEKQQDICARPDIVNCGERWLYCTEQPDQRCHDEADRIGAYKPLFCPPKQPICTNRNRKFRKPPIYLTHRKMIPRECMMKKDSGSCYRNSNSVLAFHYDHQYNDCYGFLYSRCGGNSNRFFNKSECMNHCAY